ncbi:MAG: spermidine synthase [Gemmatimonadetes bacterium]|nr:spermidine synthase [Gemmatimonadota bacterium]
MTITSQSTKDDRPTGHSYLLKTCLFATGLAGIVAEFVLSTLASYLLGNTTVQWTLIMSLMLFAMGLGSRLSRHITNRLLDRFIAVEFLLSVLCATSAAAAYFGTAFVNETTFLIYSYAGAIGLLIGLEIPLVARMNEVYETLQTNIASVMEKDYYGALFGGLLFAFFALPKLGLTYTPIALGSVNFVVASAMLWRLRNLLEHRRKLMAAFWLTAAALISLAIFIRPIVRFGEQSIYRDRVIFQTQTPYQRIVITEWKGYYWLYLNNNVQFSTYDEERYHEPLVHPAMQLAASRRNILVLGGGDGLAVREILKYSEVDSITLVDLDPEIIRLSRTQPALLSANEGSLNSPKLRVVNNDAGRFLDASSDLFDVIIVDLPDPKGPDLARLYSREFYRKCLKQLSRSGVIVTQSSSPLHATKVFLCVNKTMASSGLSVLPYHNTVPTMGDWGWNLGMRAEIISPNQLRGRATKLLFDNVDTEFLNQESLRGMVHFWKGFREAQEELEINTELNPVIDRYYRASEWGW